MLDLKVGGVFMRWIVRGAAIAICVVTAFAQQTQQPAFETASIKPSKSNEGSDIDTSLGYFRGDGTLKSFIRGAYGVTNEQIDGGPKWVDQDRYDIEARADGPARSPELLQMLQTLLADRFKLEFHRTSKVTSGYALVIAKGGLKIEQVPEGDSHSTSSSRGSMTVKNVQFTRFAAGLSRALQVPVSDETGNSGFFSFTLTFAPESSALSTSGSDAGNGGTSIFTAVQEQLGLKLEPRKVSIELLVIDRAEKP